MVFVSILWVSGALLNILILKALSQIFVSKFNKQHNGVALISSQHHLHKIFCFERATFQACIILGQTTFHVLRSSSSRKSRPGRTNCQRQFPPTFCQIIGPSSEGFVKFCTIVGHTQTLPASLGYFYCFSPTVFSFK